MRRNQITPSTQQTNKLFLFLLLLLAYSLHSTEYSFAADFSGALKRVSITDKGRVNTPPTAVIAYTQNGNTVNFDASGSSDMDGSIIEYKWNFGDVDTLTGGIVAYEYPNPGKYIITLTIVDDQGGVTLSQTEISVGSACSSQSYAYRDDSVQYDGPFVFGDDGVGGKFINDTGKDIELYSILFNISQFAKSTDNKFTMRFGISENPSVDYIKEFDFIVPADAVGEFEILLPEPRHLLENGQTIYWFFKDKNEDLAWADKLRISQSSQFLNTYKNVYSSSSGWTGFSLSNARWQKGVKICN